ncbi:hypothetical protein [Paraflavitalea sp. CAU 1676]|uniref:hypothetical protein n=1 Tax=Paraflavitalea sp. CAU 1676 TaxID=3032598 RepID=UPI0023DCE640|nr:hypothetical protein [Paraflavitalea sp. CAU 1676]MDF2187964.1 hypothetical protein [Paraflavitalea sp. CAU 1676]
MGKQKGQHPFTGKMGGTIGYKVKDEYLERENGNKEGKSFRRDPKRARTMQCAYAFGGVSKAMKPFYRLLPATQRQHGVFGALTGRATKLMRAGKTMEEVLALFQEWYVVEGRPVLVEKKGEVADGAVSGEAGAGAAGGGSVVSSAGTSSVDEVGPKEASSGQGSVVALGEAGVVPSVGVATLSPEWPSSGGVPPQPFYVIASVPAPRYWQSM